MHAILPYGIILFSYVRLISHFRGVLEDARLKSLMRYDKGIKMRPMYNYVAPYPACVISCDSFARSSTGSRGPGPPPRVNLRVLKCALHRLQFPKRPPRYVRASTRHRIVKGKVEITSDFIVAGLTRAQRCEMKSGRSGKIKIFHLDTCTIYV